MKTSDRPLVSIVSVFHNRVDFVAECVQSLLAQDYPNLEIVLFDDGSTDGTAAALQAFSDPRLKVTTQANAGFTVTLNRAIRSARGTVIALHGSGDVAAPNRISQQVEALLSAEDVGLVGCATDRSATVSGPSKQRPKGVTGNIHDWCLRIGMPFTHGAIMFRRSLFDQIGGYRDFFSLAQGRDFYLRMPAHLKFIALPEVLYFKRRPPGSVGDSPRKIILQTYLTHFSVQCAEARDRGEPDPLDQSGPQAVFLREPSVSVSRRMHGDGIRWLCYENLEGGRLFMRAAIREGVSWRTTSARLLLWASERPLVWALVKPVLKRRVRRKAEEV